jgi:hypothetical protein
MAFYLDKITERRYIYESLDTAMDLLRTTTSKSTQSPSLKFYSGFKPVGTKKKLEDTMSKLFVGSTKEVVP